MKNRRDAPSRHLLQCLDFGVHLNIFFLLMTLSFLVGLVAFRRRQTNTATRIMTFTTALGMPLVIVLQIFFVPAANGGSLGAYTLSEFTFFCCVIVLVGVLGSLRTIISATLLVLFCSPTLAEVLHLVPTPSSC